MILVESRPLQQARFYDLNVNIARGKVYFVTQIYFRIASLTIIFLLSFFFFFSINRIFCFDDIFTTSTLFSNVLLLVKLARLQCGNRKFLKFLADYTCSHPRSNSPKTRRRDERHLTKRARLRLRATIERVESRFNAVAANS